MSGRAELSGHTALVRLREQADGLSLRLVGAPLLKNDREPDLVATCAEAGFLRLVSWQYAVFYEMSKVNIPFILDRLDVLDLEGGRSAREFYELAHVLRTFFQHSISTDRDRNSRLVTRAEAWLSLVCGSVRPQSDGEWGVSLAALLREAIGFFERAVAALESIEKNAFRDDIIDQWRSRILRQHDDYEFDGVIEDVVADAGLNLHVLSVRKRFASAWKRELALRPEGYDFYLESRRLIERDLASLDSLPIIGADIIMYLGVPGGPIIGELLRFAQAYYRSNRCSQSDLLEAVRKEYIRLGR